MKKQIIIASMIALTGIIKGQSTIAGNSLSGTLPTSPTQYLGSSNAADVIFKSNLIERMRILSSGSNAGFIGIGIAAPVYKLDIVSNEVDGGIKLTQKNSGAARLILKNEAGGIEWSVNSLGTANSHGAGNFSIYDDTPYSRFFISGTGLAKGNVGIGTTNPLDKIQIGDSKDKVVMGSAAGSALNFGTSYVGFNAARQNLSSWFMSNDGANNGGSAIFGNINGDLFFSTVPSSGAFNQTVTDASIMNNVNLRIKAGNVIIGKKTSTSHPSARLSVDGDIASKAVYVTATTDWPDYVFANEYKILNLYDIEKYYQVNKHLPETPSAKEVEEIGINVGEMNALLLKKIEELTILMVKQQREIDEIKSKK